MSNTVLLIGSSGYIGRNFTKFSKNKIKVKGSHKTLNKKKRILNVLNYKELTSFIKKNKSIQSIVNLSGQYGKNYKKISLIGNKNLIKIAKTHNLNIVFLSSTLVYGDKKGSSNEKTITNPKNNYSKIKLLTEKLYLESEVNYTIIRLSNVYDDSFTKKGLLKNIKESYKLNKKFKCDNINRVRNFIHVNDFNNLLLKILKSPKKFNKKIINFSSQNFRIKDIVNFFSDKYRSTIQTIKLPIKNSEDFDNYVDNKLLIKLTKYKKFTKLENVIKDIKNYE